VGQQVGDEPAKPYRLGAEVIANVRLTRRGRMPLVEDQEDPVMPTDTIQPIQEILNRWILIGQALVGSIGALAFVIALA
jgi:hypothetical protein